MIWVRPQACSESAHRPALEEAVGGEPVALASTNKSAQRKWLSRQRLGFFFRESKACRVAQQRAIFPCPGARRQLVSLPAERARARINNFRTHHAPP